MTALHRALIAIALFSLAVGCESKETSEAAEADESAKAAEETTEKPESDEKSSEETEEPSIAGADKLETALETLKKHTLANEPDPILDRWVTRADLKGCTLEGGKEADLADKFDGRRYEAGKKKVRESLEEYQGGKLVSDYVGQEEDPAVYNGKDMVGDGCKVESGARFSIYTTVDGEDDEDVVGFEYWGFFVDGSWKIWGLDATTHDCEADYAKNRGFCKKYREL
jgi:hypothetical protein